jgi:uncharacterized protein (DUF433 family)
MATSVDIGTLIFKDPALHSGRPCITGTGTTVLAIWSLAQEGLSAQEIKAHHLPQLPLEGIYAALAYITANPDEIQNYLEEDAAAEAEWKAEVRAKTEKARGH